MFLMVCLEWCRATQIPIINGEFIVLFLLNYFFYFLILTHPYFKLKEFYYFCLTPPLLVWARPATLKGKENLK